MIVVADDAPVAALRMADYLLSQQDAAGCIPDSAGGRLCNEDSTMEYALMGLAAAGWHSKDARYREGLRRGIAWLAARQEMTDPQWRGSWRYAFTARPPYAAVPTSPGKGVKDVRGVDAPAPCSPTTFIFTPQFLEPTPWPEHLKPMPVPDWIMF